MTRDNGLMSGRLASTFASIDISKSICRVSLTRILRGGWFLAVEHFLSSAAIGAQHGSCPAAMHDRLPEEPGFFCLIANRL